MSSPTTTSAFELLDLPDGRCYVARTADAEATLVAGSFARLDPVAAQPQQADTTSGGPVGVYGSRDEAEVAVLRASPSTHAAGPLAVFAPWLRNGRS